MEKLIIIDFTKRDNFLFEGFHSHFTIPKVERVKNLKFFSSEGAIDWLLSQPWDSSNERASVEEWLVIGEEKFLLSYTLVWEGRNIKYALNDLTDSRQRRKKVLEKELSNAFL